MPQHSVPVSKFIYEKQRMVFRTEWSGACNRCLIFTPRKFQKTPHFVMTFFPINVTLSKSSMLPSEHLSFCSYYSPVAELIILPEEMVVFTNADTRLASQHNYHKLTYKIKTSREKTDNGKKRELEGLPGSCFLGFCES